MTATERLPAPSGVDLFPFGGRTFFVKRDDLIDPRYSGNKYRKLQTLLFTPKERYHALLSYGGAQSNAMLSMAHLARAKGWRFDYWCKRLPAWLEKAPTGNLKAALDLGMRLHEVPHAGYEAAVWRLRNEVSEKVCFVPQGGADPIAEAGVRVLADEIAAWAETSGYGSVTVATPSGTGTTALYLRRHLPRRFEVVTTPVVGDAAALRAQWRALEPDEARWPAVLEATGKWPFAKPRREYLKIWRALEKAGILFDLIYAPKMWLELLEAADTLEGPILYIHSGGVSGNASQLENYRFRGLLA